MKSFNILFGLLLMACFALSFIAPNNLDKVPSNKEECLVAETTTNVIKLNDADTISFAELNKFVTDELVKPVSDCLEKKDPHVFMTKCYSRVYFKLEKEHLNRKLYKNDRIQGRLIFINCSQPTVMASVYVDYSKKEISVKESFREPLGTHKEYLSSICKFIDENGIPRSF